MEGVIIFLAIWKGTEVAVYCFRLLRKLYPDSREWQATDVLFNKRDATGAVINDGYVMRRRGPDMEWEYRAMTPEEQDTYWRARMEW